MILQKGISLEEKNKIILENDSVRKIMQFRYLPLEKTVQPASTLKSSKVLFLNLFLILTDFLTDFFRLLNGISSSEEYSLSSSSSLSNLLVLLSHLHKYIHVSVRKDYKTLNKVNT